MEGSCLRDARGGKKRATGGADNRRCGKWTAGGADNGRRGQGEELTAGGVDSKEDNGRSGQLQGWILKRAVFTFKRVVFNKKRSSLIAIANKLIYCTRIVRGQREDGHPEEVELRTDRRMHSICFSKCGTCRVLVHIL